eukprot:2469175-Amphidinium_carterae.1
MLSWALYAVWNFSKGLMIKSTKGTWPKNCTPPNIDSKCPEETVGAALRSNHIRSPVGQASHTLSLVESLTTMSSRQKASGEAKAKRI